MTELTPKSFTHTIVGDVIVAIDRREADDTPTHRRDFVRTVFAAIEGLHWQLKQQVLTHPGLELSPHEQAAMTEETYNVDDRGNVNVAPRFFPLPNAIRLVVKLVQRYRPGYKVDYEHNGWANLKRAIEVRNRLVHPKTMEDLSVSDQEMNATLSGFYWVLALNVEVLEESKSAMEEVREAMKEYIAKKKSGALSTP